VQFLLPLVGDSSLPDELRQEAVRGLAKSRPGAAALVKLAAETKLDKRLMPIAGFALYAANYGNLRSDVEKLFPLPPTKNAQPLPPLSDLLKAKGNAARGKLVFDTTGTCAKCHVVNGQGKEVGPNLSEIGSKLSREAMFESILYPSAGISHNYETYLLLLDDGNTVQGILISQTPTEVSIKTNDAIVRTYKRSQIEQLEKQNISMMPADLQKVMTADELVDVIAYLSTLKKK
jgi:putative heme-binding domain-containing protein